MTTTAGRTSTLCQGQCTLVCREGNGRGGAEAGGILEHLRRCGVSPRALMTLLSRCVARTVRGLLGALASSSAFITQIQNSGRRSLPRRRPHFGAVAELSGA